ncbi:MAG: hypothetical protein EBY17_08515 [Acidobacteriia bacterium]|nr:hypothetical protein [Terriglobia bacterium]
MVRWWLPVDVPHSASANSCRAGSEGAGMTTPLTVREPVPGRVILSSCLGDISQDKGSELFLPAGLPGFETEHVLLPVEIPARRPLVFLQSVRSPDVCFVCLPVSCIVDAPFADISEDDRAGLDLDPGRNLVMGEDHLCLALLLPCGETVRTNLDAPIVINLRNYRCAQILLEPRHGSRRLTVDGTWEPVC